MCEALIFIKDNTHTDPIKDRRGAYKSGYVVVVQEDGWAWGRLESKGRWIADGRNPAEWPNEGKLGIVKIPGIPASRITSLLDAQKVDDAGNLIEGTYRRRNWRLRLDLLPLNLKNTLFNTGELSVANPATIRNYIKQIRDDVQYTGLD